MNIFIKFNFILVFIFMLFGCESSLNKELESFVTEYVNSIYDGTNFHKSYSKRQDLEILKFSRPYITKEFKIVSWENTSDNVSEFQIGYSNGSIAIITVYQEGETFVDASFILSKFKTEDEKVNR